MVNGSFEIWCFLPFFLRLAKRIYAGDIQRLVERLSFYYDFGCNKATWWTHSCDDVPRAFAKLQLYHNQCCTQP